MDIILGVRNLIQHALNTLGQERNWERKIYQSDNTSWNVSVCSRAKHGGDVTSNVAMTLAKSLKESPKNLAAKLIALIRNDDLVYHAEMAGPGFINIQLERHVFISVLKEIWEKKRSYGSLAIVEKENKDKDKDKEDNKLHLEFVSANPTGPLHVGHTRGAVFGDTLARLLRKRGFNVYTEYYVNDAGQQIDVLARSAYLRYQEALGQQISSDMFSNLYPGTYLKEVGKILVEQYQTTLLHQEEVTWMPLVREVSVQCMMTLIRDDLKRLNVEHDFFFLEKNIIQEIPKMVDLLKEKDLVYFGILKPPKGKRSDLWQEQSNKPKLLFKSTAFGDDEDRALQKSDGTWTYFAADMAYHFHKLQRGFKHIIDVLGADHAGYADRLGAVCEALSNRAITLDVKICALVRLFKNKEPYKMSKRSGDFITLKDLIDEVGVDSVRFMMLTKKQDIPIDFDFDVVKDQSRDNWNFYVNYAYARIFSVKRNAREILPESATYAYDEINFDLLNDPNELAIMRHMGFYESMLNGAAMAAEPHRIVFYLYELASLFHTLWSGGLKNTQLRFLVKDDIYLTKVRLFFLETIAYVIESAFDILGITPVEEMR